MPGVITWSQGTDIGGGRGRLADEPAQSLARVDAEIGHYLDINEAWRDPAVADRLYADYVSGRSKVIALPGKDSIHCRGYAIDTDEQRVDLLLRHGWKRTVYRNGKLAEPWHFEYFPDLDQHRSVPMVKGADGVWRIATAPESRPEEDDMPINFRNLATGISYTMVPGYSITQHPNEFGARLTGYLNTGRWMPESPSQEQRADGGERQLLEDHVRWMLGFYGFARIGADLGRLPGPGGIVYADRVEEAFAAVVPGIGGVREEGQTLKAIRSIVKGS